MSEHNNTERRDVEHATTTKPWYEPEKQQNQWDYITQWSDEGDEVPHDQSRDYGDDRHPLVFDIESNAEFPQRPILATAFDELSGVAWVALDYGRNDYRPEPAEVEEMVTERFNQSGYTVAEVRMSGSLGVSWFDKILDFVSDREEPRVLVAHNAFYDLGILGSDYDELLEEKKINNKEWDGVIQYNNWMCQHKRAGAYGRIYNFVNTGDGVSYSNIPVADTMVAAKSIRHDSKLEDLADQMDVEYEDNATEHGTLTDEYVKYNIDDVVATLEVYNAIENYIRTALASPLPVCKVFSSASIGKDVLRRMNYDRTHYTEDAMKIAAKSYFGGQTEALKTGEIIQDVTYSDLMSQYPSASALTRVWEFMRAERVECHAVSGDELPNPTLDDFTDELTWQACADYYVLVEADGATMPVRVEDEWTETTRVKNANVEHDDACFYHYLDVVGAKLRGGDVEIKKAWCMKPVGKQDVNDAVIGDTVIQSDENVMKKCIEERKRIQYDVNDGDKDENTLALKIVANSLYGVSAERIVMEREKKTTDENGQVKTVIERHDVAGSFYNPHVASAITAAGRFMLTLGELVANQNDGELIYCDTDSLVISDNCADDVMEYFNESLNPYDGVAGEQDFLEIEDAKHNGEEIDLKNVGIFAIGVKKYAIIKDDDEVVKWTEHGLGHYEYFRDDETVKKFWATMINQPMFNELVYTEGLNDEDMNHMIKWQVSASTYEVRKMMSKLTNQEVRYGDFIQRTICVQPDKAVQYIGIDLDEQAVEVIDHGDRIELNEVDGVKPEYQKTVADVVQDWKETARHNMFTDGRPRVRVVGQRTVTKEATDTKTSWEDSLLKAIRSYLFDWF